MQPISPPCPTLYNIQSHHWQLKCHSRGGSCSALIISGIMHGRRSQSETSCEMPVKFYSQMPCWALSQWNVDRKKQIERNGNFQGETCSGWEMGAEWSSLPYQHHLKGSRDSWNSGRLPQPCFIQFLSSRIFSDRSRSCRAISQWASGLWWSLSTVLQIFSALCLWGTR